MKFAPEGYYAAFVPAAAALLVAIFGSPLAVYALAAVALGVLLFFRDPDREPEGDASSIVSPADGRVVAVESLSEGHEMAPTSLRRISIFMSPLDVHVNRSPAAGVVEALRHRPGQFRAAYAADASDVNESNSLLLRTAEGYRLVVVQIAGWMARRIVCRVAEGAKLARGERFGLIMFGSRVDVYLPEGIEPSVARGTRVRAGRSVIAKVLERT